MEQEEQPRALGGVQGQAVQVLLPEQGLLQGGMSGTQVLRPICEATL